MNTKRMPVALFEDYSHDPLAADDRVRQAMNVPEDRYYTVTIWPPERAGLLTVDTKRNRAVPRKKISKSDQK